MTTNYKPSDNNRVNILELTAVWTFHDMLFTMLKLKAGTVEGKQETVWRLRSLLVSEVSFHPLTSYIPAYSNRSGMECTNRDPMDGETTYADDVTKRTYAVGTESASEYRNRVRLNSPSVSLIFLPHFQFYPNPSPQSAIL
jgi:hypothetical protein